MRIAVLGTPDFAVPTLRALSSSSHQVVGVVTQPDRPRGRGQKVLPGPVKLAATEIGVPILQPDRLKDDTFLAAFDALGADLGVVAAYGKLLPQPLLDLPRLGMVNVHASLLPRWRGAAPIHRAILAGDADTGVTIMRVVLALDAGPMLAHARVAIGPDDTSVAIERQLADAGAALLVETIDAIALGRAVETPQDDARVTYAHRLERADSQVDWSRPARAIHDQIRGLQPWPLAAAIIGGHRLRLVASTVSTTPAVATPGTVVAVTSDAIVIATGSGHLNLTRVQPDGRAVMAVRDFLNGRRVSVGERFAALPSE